MQETQVPFSFTGHLRGMGVHLETASLATDFLSITGK